MKNGEAKIWEIINSSGSNQLDLISLKKMYSSKHSIELRMIIGEKIGVRGYQGWLAIKSLINKYGGHEDQLSRVPAGIEQYRIQSLEKILKTVNLTQAQSNATRKMLLRKMNIFLNGLNRRGRSVLAKEIEKKIAYWTVI